MQYRPGGGEGLGEPRMQPHELAGTGPGSSATGGTAEAGAKEPRAYLRCSQLLSWNGGSR